MNKIVNEVLAEIERAQAGLPAGFDNTNTKNDWVGYVTAYAGRAADKVFRNEREGQTFRDNMVKVAALAITAIAVEDSKAA